MAKLLPLLEIKTLLELCQYASQKKPKLSESVSSIKNVTWSARRKTIASRYSDNKLYSGIANMEIL